MFQSEFTNHSFPLKISLKRKGGPIPLKKKKITEYFQRNIIYIFVICLHFDSLIDILTNATSSSGMSLQPLIDGTFYENF
jgi:hypothetical protein